jgi:predicted transcriptional regulator
LTYNHSRDEFDELFKLLGNKTRRELLHRLAREPMFLGQISRELSIGQQAIIRHLRELIEQGFLESYEDESIRGPPRKYYRLSKTVRLTVQITPEGLRVVRIIPAAAPPESVEERLQRQYPELARLVFLANQLSKIPDPLDRKQNAINIIRTLETKAKETKEISRYLQIFAKRLRDEFL